MKVFIPHYSNEVEKRVLKEKATMEKPQNEEFWKSSIEKMADNYVYKHHLASLKTIPMPGMTPEFGKREEVVEGVDFRLQHQANDAPEPYGNWHDISEGNYFITVPSRRRIIATAIEGKPDLERGVTISTGSRFTPSYDLFMSGGNTDDEKAWFELGCKAAKKEAAAQSTNQILDAQLSLISGYIGKIDLNKSSLEDIRNHLSADFEYLQQEANVLASKELTEPHSETVPDEILKDLSDFFKYSAYRGGFTISKFGGSFIIKFSDGAKAKYSIEMYKGSESTLDDQPKTTQSVEQPVGEQGESIAFALTKLDNIQVYYAEGDDGRTNIACFKYDDVVDLLKSVLPTAPASSGQDDDTEFKYRNTVIEIDAIQYIGNGNFEQHGLPDWIWRAFEDKTLEATNGCDPLILTAHGKKYTVNPTDYIIKRHGYLQVSPYDAFHACYERIAASHSQKSDASVEQRAKEDRDRELLMKQYYQGNLGRGLLESKRDGYTPAYLAGHSSQLPTDAVEFAEWIAEHDYKPGTGNEHWYKWNGMECKEVPYTTIELYYLFKQRGK